MERSSRLQGKGGSKFCLSPQVPVSSAQVLDVPKALDGEDSGVHVAEVLVFGEADFVGGFPADVGLALLAGGLGEGFS